MNVIATTTVIRGNGACEAFMNGIVNEEIKKMNERHERELMTLSNELEATKNKEKQLLAEKLPMVRALAAKRYRPLSEVREKLEVAWAVVWYLGMKFGLWNDDGKNTETAV